VVKFCYSKNLLLLLLNLLLLLLLLLLTAIGLSPGGSGDFTCTHIACAGIRCSETRLYSRNTFKELLSRS